MLGFARVRTKPKLSGKGRKRKELCPTRAPRLLLHETRELSGQTLALRSTELGIEELAFKTLLSHKDSLVVSQHMAR